MVFLQSTLLQLQVRASLVFSVYSCTGWNESVSSLSARKLQKAIKVDWSLDYKIQIFLLAASRQLSAAPLRAALSLHSSHTWELQSVYLAHYAFITSGCVSDFNGSPSTKHNFCLATPLLTPHSPPFSRTSHYYFPMHTASGWVTGLWRRSRALVGTATALRLIPHLLFYRSSVLTQAILIIARWGIPVNELRLRFGEDGREVEREGDSPLTPQASHRWAEQGGENHNQDSKLTDPHRNRVTATRRKPFLREWLQQYFKSNPF